jgi:predicted NBD/HSP70 family sugar kinase
MLDITPSTVTRLTTQLMDDGLLSERADGDRKPQKGYPAKLLHLNPRGLCTAGVYLDPDRIMTCISSLSGEVLAQDEAPVPDRSFEAIMSAAGAGVKNLMSAANVEMDRMAGCGVSYPGRYSQDPSRVMRIRQFQDWPPVNVRRDLSPYFGMPVQHMNDAKAACLAELHHGTARNLKNFCYIWLSYGIGGAAVVDQRPYFGRNNGAAEWGGLFPKSQPRPSGQDLLDVLGRAGLPLERLSDFTDEHLEHSVVAQWRERASEQIRWLCLVIARTFAPQGIVIGGTLHGSIIDGFIRDLTDRENLGTEFDQIAPQMIRASRDHLPQLGPAALPVHNVLSPARYLGQVSKGW